MKKKIITITLIIALLIVFFQIAAYAGGSTAGGTGFQWSSQLDQIVTGTGDSEVVKPIDNVAGTIVTVTQIISVGVAIIMLIVLGMKYMMSAPGDRATIKKHAVVYIVGAIIMFGAAGLLGLIRNFANVISATGNGGETGAAVTPTVQKPGGATIPGALPK